LGDAKVIGGAPESRDEAIAGRMDVDFATDVGSL